MPAKVRAFVGVVTTIVFLTIGSMLLGEGHTRWASVVLALGALRGALVAQQIVKMVSPPEEEPPTAP